MDDYFDILGVDENSSQEEIKKAYHKMLKKYHPDNYKGDVKFANEMTRKISLAYEVLSTEKSREEYIKDWKKQCDQKNDVRSHYASDCKDGTAKRKTRTLTFSFDQIFQILIVVVIVICIVSCAIYFLPNEVMQYFQRVYQNIEKFINSFK